MPASLGYVIAYVADVGASLAFYESAFGLERRFLTPEGDYGELATGQTTLAFASQELATANLDSSGGFTPLSSSPSPAGVAITLTTDDVAATVEAALAAGGTIYGDPLEKPWGQTVAYVVDPDGLLVEVATPMAPA